MFSMFGKGGLKYLDPWTFSDVGGVSWWICVGAVERASAGATGGGGDGRGAGDGAGGVWNAGGVFSLLFLAFSWWRTSIYIKD